LITRKEMHHLNRAATLGSACLVRSRQILDGVFGAGFSEKNGEALGRLTQVLASFFMDPGIIMMGASPNIRV
jgi:hypothetical protein